MSVILRLTRTLRPTRLPTHSQTLPSHFFSPTRTPLSLPRYRLYSSFRPNGASQSEQNMMILYTLMGTNVAIFSYAMYLKTLAMQGHPIKFQKFIQNMTLNLEDFRAGRWWSLVTANFTHLQIGHIFSNMFTVYFLGRFLAFSPIITPARYLVIAVGSGVTGAAGYLYNRYLQTQGSARGDVTRGLGFSGAVMGISSVAACLAPTAQVQLYGIIPLPLWALVAGYAAYDGYYVNSSDSRIGHAGHLGGLAFGLAYYALRLRKLRF